jgi:phosphatidylserine/phosphatidylglycerophosphate/cardiolipin synthase-like enzyme
MKRKYLWIVIFFVGIVFYVAHFAIPKFFLADDRNIASSSGALSLITEPDDGIMPVLGMINSAMKSVDLVMYELDDAQVEAALVADERRGVVVRVLLSPGYDGAPSRVNGSAYNFLLAHGVAVRWSPSYFSLTHEKSLVVDGIRAIVMTFNLTSKYYATGRDFGIVDGNTHDVAAMERTFGDDWKGSPAGASSGAVAGNVLLGGNNGDAGDNLVWSPGSEPSLIALINSAKKSLYIYNEEMADMNVTKAIIDAGERGVVVYVVMTGAEEWKWDFAELATAGVHVRTYADDANAPLYIHAKMIVADGGNASARAFVGSENFSAASLGKNRELGIVTDNKDIITSLIKTFVADWHGATPFVL